MEDIEVFLLKSKEWFERLVETIREYAKKYEESEKWLSTTLSSIGDAVIATDRLGNVQFINPIAEALTGYTREKSIGKPLEDILKIINEETRKSVENPVSRVLREGVVVGLANHTVLIAKNGKEIPIADSGAPIKDDKGNIMGVVLVFRDITERRKAEEINLKLAAIVENSDDAIIGKTLDGTIISWNKGAERIYSYTSKEIMGKPISILVPSDRPDEVPHILEKIKAGDRIDHFETVRVRKDGEEINISLTISPIKDKDGSIIGASTIARDITEQKKAEQILKKSQEQLNTIFSNLKDIVFVISEDHKILFKNETAHNIFGESLIGEKCYEVIKGLDHPCEQCPIKTFKEKDVCLLRFEQCVDTPLLEGTKYFDIITSKIEDYGGVSAIVEVFRDITEQKKAEAEIRKLSAYNRNLIEVSLDPLVTIGQDGKIMDVNRATEKVTGRSREELIGNGFSSYFTEPEKASEGYQKVFETGSVQDYALEIQHVDGHIIPVLYNASTFRDEDGNIAGVFAAARDITEQKKAEQELKDTQEELVRKEKLAIIGKLASGIGHELRNPIGVISNSIYYLNMKIKDADVKVRKHLNIIQKEVERSNIIITDLLDFARIRPLSLEKVEIGKIIKETLDNIKLPEDIILEKNIDAELPRIQLDPNQIQRAFQNIILNAIQAMLEGGKLEIKTLTRENLLEIIFKDTGVGIPKENLEKIFEPLFTTKATGIGLGLSIVKDIVENHNGKIEVESKVDVGTTLIVKLPFLRKEGI